MWKQAWWVLLAPMTACMSSADHDTGDNGVVPLAVQYTSSGGMRLGAWIQIGAGPAFLAMVDTGSSGLRVMPRAVDDGAFASISDSLVSYSYHSGLALQGVVAEGAVTIGGQTTPTTIPIMRVREVGCTAEVPDCDANGASADDYQAFGYDAVLGIGMRTLDSAGGIGNPIAQLAGEPGYVVRAPAYGGNRGELEIGASLAQPGAMTSVQLPSVADGVALGNGVPAWDDREVPTCVTDVTHATPYCAGGLLDTGSTTTQLEWPTYAGAPRTWASGTQVAVAIDAAGASAGSGAPLASYGFTVGAVPTPGIDEVVSETRTNATEDLINLGTAIFLRYDVWFDQAGGQIGFAGHSP